MTSSQCRLDLTAGEVVTSSGESLFVSWPCANVSFRLCNQ